MATTTKKTKRKKTSKKTMSKTNVKSSTPKRVKITKDVVSRNLDGEEVILNLETGVYFAL